MTIAAQECAGVYIVMGCQKDRPYPSWADGVSEGQTISELDRPFLEVEVDPERISS